MDKWVIIHPTQPAHLPPLSVIDISFVLYEFEYCRSFIHLKTQRSMMPNTVFSGSYMSSSSLIAL